jgi:single-stranded-DNA-specific exonuclease
VARILVSRGIDATGKLEQFLNLSHLPHDPHLLPGMDQAVERLRRAVNDGELVGVFGDFDVDGITGTAIMS